eukprot:1061856-Pleurochrysis_carterae.AAC.2
MVEMTTARAVLHSQNAKAKRRRDALRVSASPPVLTCTNKEVILHGSTFCAEVCREPHAKLA